MTTKSKIAEIGHSVGAGVDGAAFRRGWHWDGTGPARFGWALVYPTGRAHFLGRTLADVVKSREPFYTPEAAAHR